MKHLHYTYCLVGVAIGVVLLIALGASASTLGFLAVVLACPLMMLVMMRAMGDSQRNAPRDESTEDSISR
jgi:hypothetical protein